MEFTTQQLEAAHKEIISIIKNVRKWKGNLRKGPHSIPC